MTLSDAVNAVRDRKPVLQEQTAKERLIFALLHPSKGVGHRIGVGHVGEQVGYELSPSIGTHGSYHPERGFTQRTFEQVEHVHQYHVGFDTAQKVHGAETNKAKLKELKSQHNKILFRINQEKEAPEAARYRGFLDGLHKIAGSTPADLGEAPKPEPVKPKSVMTHPPKIPTPKPAPDLPKNPPPLDLSGGKKINEIPPAPAGGVPHYSDQPALQNPYDHAYRIALAKYAGASHPELDAAERMAKNGSMDGFAAVSEVGYYQLPKDAKKAATEGALEAIKHLRSTAPDLPTELPRLPEHAPGGKWHEGFELSKRNYLRQNYLKPKMAELIAERNYGLGDIRRGTEAHHEGVIMHAYARVAAVDQVLREPFAPRSAVPEKVEKLKPAEVVKRFGANRYELASSVQNTPAAYNKTYRDTLKEAKKNIAGRDAYERIRARAEIAYHFSDHRIEKLQYHAQLAALDDFAEGLPTFGPKTSTYDAELARNEVARTRAEAVHARAMSALQAAVDKAAVEATRRNEIAAGPGGTGNVTPPYLDEQPLVGTSPEMERLSEDLHRLGHYDQIPIYEENGAGFLGMYRKGISITTNSIAKTTDFAMGPDGPLRDKKGNLKFRQIPHMNQHAKTLAHEFGHHYSFMDGKRFENFTNTDSPHKPNRDEIVAEMVAYNLSLHYGQSSEDRSHGYVFRMTGNDPALTLLKDPDVQEVIKHTTAQILASISRSNEGITHLTEDDATRPKNIFDYKSFTPGNIPRYHHLNPGYNMFVGEEADPLTRFALTHGTITEIAPVNRNLAGVNTTYTGRLHMPPLIASRVPATLGADRTVLIKPVRKKLYNDGVVPTLEAPNLAAVAINHALGDLMITPEVIARNVSLNPYQHDPAPAPTRSLVSNWFEHATPGMIYNQHASDLNRDIALFDVVSGNGDRNSGNWLIVHPPGESEYAVGIDHDLILEDDYSLLRYGPSTDHAGEPLTQRQLDGLQSALDERVKLNALLQTMGVDDTRREKLFQRISWLLTNQRFPDYTDLLATDPGYTLDQFLSDLGRGNWPATDFGKAQSTSVTQEYTPPGGGHALSDLLRSARVRCQT